MTKPGDKLVMFECQYLREAATVRCFVGISQGATSGVNSSHRPTQWSALCR